MFFVAYKNQNHKVTVLIPKGLYVHHVFSIGLRVLHGLMDLIVVTIAGGHNNLSRLMLEETEAFKG